MDGMGFYSEKELKEVGFLQIGKNVLISKKTSIYFPEKMEIGDNVRIDDFCILIGRIKLGRNIHIGGFSYVNGGKVGIEMDDYSGLSQRCSLYSQSDDYSGTTMTNPTVPDEYKMVKSGKIVLGKHVIVGASSVILPGVHIAEGASIGAMSLVNKDIDEWTVNCGVPCKKIRSRKRDLLSLQMKYEEKYS